MYPAGHWGIDGAEDGAVRHHGKRPTRSVLTSRARNPSVLQYYDGTLGST